MEKKHGLPAGLLLAIGSRETNLRDTIGDGGHGHGVWQIDDRWHKIPVGVEAQADYAAMLLATNIKSVGLDAGVAAYNGGLTGVKTAMAAGKSPDSATTGGDYAADVLGRLQHITGTTTPKPPAKPAAKPVVDLSNVRAAAQRDPDLKQGGTTHAADVKLVEDALRREGLLSKTYASDGSFGSTTVAAYASWQRRLGYQGRGADGIPGKDSLTRLGAKHGFTVKA